LVANHVQPERSFCLQNAALI